MRALAPAVLASAALLAACPRAIGDRCFAPDDCGAVAGGYCARVQVCTRPCGPEQPACPPGSACHVVDGRRTCLRSCSDGKPCNLDERCEPDAGVCLVVDPLKRPHEP